LPVRRASVSIAAYQDRHLKTEQRVREAAMKVALVTICLWGVTPVHAQSVPGTPSEEIEPRIVGEPGTTSIGVAGFVDRFFSPETVLPANYTIQVDGARFLTNRFALRVGVAGTGTFGGESDTDEPTGAGAPSLHGMGGLLFYFTPKSLLSLYVGSEYWLQITRRASPDSGSVLGKAGLHGALSSRDSFFVEAGAGAALTRGSEGELLTRFVGQLGLRIKL
jgi:hypothetical protein